MSDAKSSSTSPMKILWMVVVFIAVFLLLKYVIGIAFAILKWVLIAGVAVVVTALVFGKGKDKGTGS